MYLFHNTNIESLKSILSSNYLKSYSVLKKENNLIKQGESAGIYDKNKFVYFSCTDDIFDKRIYSRVTLYFNLNLLNNRTFYTSEYHSFSPNILDAKNKFSKKYDSDTKKENIPIILEKIYKNSISYLPNGKAFQVFQQIAISNKVNIKKYLVAVEFKKCNRSDKKLLRPIIDYLKNKYPSIKIKNNNI